MQNLKHQTRQNEKKLEEEERHLDKCKQVLVFVVIFLLSYYLILIF